MKRTPPITVPHSASIGLNSSVPFRVVNAPMEEIRKQIEPPRLNSEAPLMRSRKSPRPASGCLADTSIALARTKHSDPAMSGSQMKTLCSQGLSPVIRPAITMIWKRIAPIAWINDAENRRRR